MACNDRFLFHISNHQNCYMYYLLRIKLFEGEQCLPVVISESVQSCDQICWPWQLHFLEYLNTLLIGYLCTIDCHMTDPFVILLSSNYICCQEILPLDNILILDISSAIILELRKLLISVSVKQVTTNCLTSYRYNYKCNNYQSYIP